MVEKKGVPQGGVIVGTWRNYCCWGKKRVGTGMGKMNRAGGWKTPGGIGGIVDEVGGQTCWGDQG